MFDYSRISGAFEGVFRKYESSFFAKESDFVRIPGKKKDGSQDLSVAYLEFEKFHIEIVYTGSAPMYNERSLLSCRVYPDNREKILFFSPWELLYPAHDQKRRMWVFPFIESCERMCECADYMLRSLLEVLPLIEELSRDFERVTLHYEKKRLSLSEFFRTSTEKYEDEIGYTEVLGFKMAYYDGWLTGLYSSKAFGDLTSGKNTPAIVRAVTDTVTPDFVVKMYEENAKGLCPEPSFDKSVDTASDFRHHRRSFSGLIYLIAAFIIFAPVFFIAYFGLYILTARIVFSSALTVLLPPAGLPVLLVSLLTSAASAYFTQKAVISVASIKNKKRLIYHELLKGSGEARIGRIILNVVLVFSLILTVLLGKSSIAFFDRGISDSREIFSISSKFYEYEDIDKADISANDIKLSLNDGRNLKISARIGDSEAEKISELLRSKGISVNTESIPLKDTR